MAEMEHPMILVGGLVGDLSAAWWVRNPAVV